MLYFSLEDKDLDEYQDFNEIMKTYGNDVLRVAYVFVKDMQLAKDICQDVFVRALVKKVYLIPKDKQRTWLMKVTIKMCKNNKKSYFSKNVNLDTENRTVVEYTSEHEVDGEIIEDAGKRTIVQAIYELPMKYKEIVILYYYQWLDSTMIAEILGLPCFLVKNRVTRAQELLAEKLKKNGGEACVGI